jgi:ABC-type nickel/cobalt efflux system permease component RcnA
MPSGSGALPVPATLLAATALLSSPAGSSYGHDIPNARVDRSIQVTIRPGKLAVAYEVSLSELTLTQELRSLIGALPGADRDAWFAAYGRETGPLNAKGLLVWAGDEPRELVAEGFDLVVEEHPRYTFRFGASIPPAGRLRVRDTNFATSQGTSRLAVRGEGVTVRGDDLPADVEAIPARPVWQLSDEEERRTREVRVEYEAAGSKPDSATRLPSARPRPVRSEPAGLSRLLDRSQRWPVAWLALLALALGAAHAFQPGHGKTLVAASVVAEGGGWLPGALLAVVTTLTHAGSVFLFAGVLWWTGAVELAGVHRALTRASGFVIAAVGLWRLGWLSAGFKEHEGDDVPAVRGAGRLIGLGMAGGAVPCWDAVGLIVLAAAVGRFGLGLILAAAFSAGMGLVLVGFGWAVSRLKGSFRGLGAGSVWERRLGLFSGAALSALGVFLLRP